MLCVSLHGGDNNEFLMSNVIVVINSQLKANIEIGCGAVSSCCGVTKDPNENDYLLVFHYAKNGDLHNNLSKKFKEITWEQKIYSVYNISLG